MEKMKLPSNTIRVRTFKEFRKWVTDFANGKYPQLLILGPAGISKSRTMKDAVKDKPHLYYGVHLTPFYFYIQLYKNRNVLVIIDDIDSIYEDRQSIRLLKFLCDTDPVKTIPWGSYHKLIANGEIPDHFETTSHLCIIGNEWDTLNTNVQAFESRAAKIYFAPGALEVHTEVKNWFKNKLVYDYIGKWLSFVQQPDMRYYFHGDTFYKADPHNWKRYLLLSMGIGEQIIAFVRICSNPKLRTQKERAEAFTKHPDGASRATFFKIQGMFRKP